MQLALKGRRRPCHQVAARLQSFLGEKTLAYAMLGLLLLLLVPYGAFILLPVILFLSFLSPAGRLDWRENRTQRLVAIGLVIMMLGVYGLVPLDPPRAPEEWGETFATELSDLGFSISDKFVLTTNHKELGERLGTSLHTHFTRGLHRGRRHPHHDFT